MKFTVEVEIDDELIEELAELQGCSKEKVIEWFKKYFSTVLSNFSEAVRYVLDVYESTEDAGKFIEAVKNYAFNFGAEVGRKVGKEVFGDEQEDVL